MEQIGKLLEQAGPEKLQKTTQQPSQPLWAGLLWTLAQSRSKELTAPEIALWKAKLSGYPNDLVEWALVNYNGEFFPNPSTICRMVEVKRESLAAEQENREWEAWKATKRQAEREGQLATPEQKRELLEHIRKIAFGPPLIPMKPLGVKSGKSGEAVQVQRSSEQRAQNMAPQVGDQREANQDQRTGQADV